MQTNSRIQKKTKLKKDWNNHLETTKTKLSNKKSYIYWFLFSFKSRDIFGTTTFQNQTKLVQIDGSKQNQEKNTTKMFDTITSMPFMYDECLCNGWEPAVGPGTTCNRSSHFQYFWHTRRTRLRVKRGKSKFKKKSHINTLWDCYHEKKTSNGKHKTLQRWRVALPKELRAQGLLARTV